MNSANLEVLSAAITARFGDRIHQLIHSHAELTIEVDPEHYLSVCQELRDAPEFQFQQLIDLCGVDYLAYGQDEWQTESATSSGFSRGVESQSTGRLQFGDELNAEFSGPRFAVVLHLLSYQFNQRLRVRCFAADNDLPVVASVTDLWNCADWYEREAFDLYGILFEGHADLRRLLTDYGFVGHPFRKDFPLVGHVEMRYDPETKRVIYQPVSIEPRVLVPRVIRDDFRYVNSTAEQSNARNS